MRVLFTLMILTLTINIQGQTEVLVGDSIVETSLIIQKGALVIGDQTTASPTPGTIKFTEGAFMGFDGDNWVNLSPQEKYILGPSVINTDGSVEFGSLTGLEAATAICKAAYPNDPSAHFYSSVEIDKAIENGNVNGITTNTKYWTLIHTFHGLNANNSANNNCFCFLLNETAIGRGTTITFFFQASETSTQLAGYFTNYQFGEQCNTVLPIICGR